tara:strand:+ start:3497 stop:4591 length:1095 start_codon:yes stop_codon:yes gene_type:complete
MKIKLACIKFAGMASSGVEKYLQTIAALLPKDKFDIDFFYTNAAPFIRSSFVHPVNDDSRLEFVKSHGVNTIKVDVEAKIGDKQPYEWINTNFWSLFNEDDYDFILTGRGGYPEYPFNLINKTKIIDTIHSFDGEDKPNIAKAILLCKWQAEKWASSGGNIDKAVIIPTIVKVPPKQKSNIREKLNIPDDAFVYGFHQGNREEIFSPVSLMAYNQIKNNNNFFVIMGGASRHRSLAKKINCPNIKFIDHCSSVEEIHNFLSGIDVFAHARADGEVCSAAMIEALYHGKPIISHPALNMGHAEQLEGCGKMAYSVNEYAGHMISYEEDRALYQKDSENALNKYKNFYDYKKVQEKIVSVFLDLTQ